MEELVHHLVNKDSHNEVDDVLECMKGEGCSKGTCKTCK